MTYYRLLDQTHKGVIVRMEGREQQQFIPGRGWVDSGILIHYFWPESDTFERYKVISEDEALAEVGGVA